MDPLSVLGAAVGVTSLIIQVTDECIKGFRLFNEASNFPETHTYLRVRFRLEQQRFLNFGLEAGILHADGVVCSSLQINRAILIAALAEIKILLEQYASMNGRYADEDAQDLMDWEDTSEPESDLIDLLHLPNRVGLQAEDDASKNSLETPSKHMYGLKRKIAHAGKKFRTVLMEPKRLIWATVDKDAFELLISKLGHLNSVLTSLLDSSQVRRLQDATNSTYLEVLQLRNDVVSLKILIKALTPSKGVSQALSPEIDPSTFSFLSRKCADETAAQVKTRSYLRELAEIKIRFTLLNQPDNKCLIDDDLRELATLLPLEQFSLDETVLHYDSQQLRLSTTYQGNNVWIEWTNVLAAALAPYTQLLESRIVMLTHLLRLVKPEGFRAPVCLGFTKIWEDDIVTRFGIVFEKPYGSTTSITSLRDLLGRGSTPSLSTRISLCAVLARCVHSFHTVSWLHKALRPHNIIYYSSSPELDSPLISGFELSRPSILDELTEKPRFDARLDIYRHPNAQSSRTDGSYRRSYDIYSLGILLIEIALWMPIEDIVGLKDLPKAKPSVILEMQSYVLGTTGQYATAGTSAQCLPRVASACGDTFRNIVEFCLRADRVDDPSHTGESEAIISLRLHRLVEQDIVKQLERVAGAL